MRTSYVFKFVQYVIHLDSKNQRVRDCCHLFDTCCNTRRSRQDTGPSAASSRKKCEYGAWYLQPTTWQKRPAGEPLQDPNDTKGKDISEAKQRSLELVWIIHNRAFVLQIESC